MLIKLIFPLLALISGMALATQVQINGGLGYCNLIQTLDNSV